MRICTGIDLVEISRIRSSLQNPRFLTRVFSSAEREYLQGKKDMAPSAAANFAAKEAFSKALGTGVRGFSLCEVSVLRDSLGAPYLLLEGKAAAIAQGQGLSFSVSLTHTREYASAVVVAYSEQKQDEGE